MPIYNAHGNFLKICMYMSILNLYNKMCTTHLGFCNHLDALRTATVMEFL